MKSAEEGNICPVQFLLGGDDFSGDGHGITKWVMDGEDMQVSLTIVLSLTSF